MQILKDKLEELINLLSQSDINNIRLDKHSSVYPFNKYEFIFSTLLGLGKISFDAYLEIRDEYIARNKYLGVFEISAPRKFGEQWAEKHIMKLAPILIKPTKKVDPNYSGQYDLLYKLSEEKQIKIEVKASRAVDFNSKEALYVKALSVKSDIPFDMNFQQVKPKCCDVFLWVGVWRDKIRYWVLSSKEVKTNKYYSKGQHRGNTGEGQLHLKDENIKYFEQYEVESTEILQKVIEAYNR